jgi:uncharacterized membrane protein YjgN (DUF898 family)
MSVTPAEATAETPAESVWLAFVGNRRDYWRLMLRGNALQGITLGLYRFWLFSDMRRFLWASIELDGENFEYVGTAGELLVGFLMGLGILIPVNMLLFYALLEVGTPVQTSVMFLVLLAFVEFAIFRARAYRLSRTVLRGLRFRQTGSGLVYMARAILWWIAVVLTLGLAGPFMEASLDRYKMRNTWFGNIGGDFVGSGAQLFARTIALWLTIIVPPTYAIVRAASGIDWAKVGELTSDSNADAIALAFGGNARLGSLGDALIFAVLWGVFFTIALYPAYTAIVMRWWLDGLRIGGVKVASDLPMRGVYGAWLRFLWYVLAFTLAFAVVAGLVAGAVVLALSPFIDFSVTSTPRDAVLAILGIGTYVAYILGCSAIYAVVVKMRIWQLAVESSRLTGLAALDNVEARPAPCSAIGEGIADALGGGRL